MSKDELSESPVSFGSNSNISPTFWTMPIETPAVPGDVPPEDTSELSTPSDRPEASTPSISSQPSEPTDHKLDETATTEQSSIITLDTSHLSIVNTSNELFLDVVEGLGDLAAMSVNGIFQSHSLSTSANNDLTSKEEEEKEEEGINKKHDSHDESNRESSDEHVESAPLGSKTEPGKIRNMNVPIGEGASSSSSAGSQSPDGCCVMRWSMGHGYRILINSANFGHLFSCILLAVATH